MNIEKNIPQLEEILAEWKGVIGDDFSGYRNHVYRMIHCCLAIQNCSEEEKEKIFIAAAFHDIGIWIENTMDYLPPSVPPAMNYLAETGKEDWSEEIRLMITEHHKITTVKDDRYPLVELFRKGDLVDFSLGLVTFGLSGEYLKQLKAAFPNAGFHACLIKHSTKWILKHPLNPAPMYKW